ncbi:odorant binding protein 5 [Lasioglossum baleicum]|uniref:odorant binding protein 5 n=1 Tax=Lasioglossum baleicum TaxID=434251 RepID=UPI003FCCFF34
MHARHLLLGAMLVCVALKPVHSAVSQEQLEKVANSMRRGCLQKIDTTEELASGVRKGEFPDDPNVACYTLCIMQTMRSFKNGGVDGKMILRQVDATMTPESTPRIKEAIKGCLTKEFDAPDDCQLAYLYTKCVHDADPEVFFFP